MGVGGRGEVCHDSCFPDASGECPLGKVPMEMDLVFLGAVAAVAQPAYALSNLSRSRGAITVLGGPHARCYPEDAVRFFDYVLGFTDKALVADVLKERAPQRPLGRQLGAVRQPRELPGVQQRWKFIAPTIARAPTFKIVPMI